jgi:hypothetical protein
VQVRDGHGVGMVGACAGRDGEEGTVGLVASPSGRWEMYYSFLFFSFFWKGKFIIFLRERG